MRTFSLLMALLFVSSLSFAQKESDKTLVKSLNPEECPNVKIDIKNEKMAANPWDEGTVRVELDVRANVPEAILVQLVKAGRYSIEGGKDGDTYTVKAPNLNKSIFIGGKALEETISINVKTPGHYAITDEGILSKDINAAVIAARSDNPEEAAKILKEMKKIKEDVNMHLNVVSTSKYNGDIDLSKYKIVVDGVETTADKISFGSNKK